MNGARRLAARLPAGRSQLALAAYYVRRGLSRVDNAEVRAARRLVTRMRSDPPDVLYFGESTVSFVSSSDRDRRQLFEMVADLLGPGIALSAVHGGGYHPALYDAFLRLLTPVEDRPVVIVPLWVRGRTLPWIEHPIYGHKQATTFVGNADPRAAARKLRAGFRRPSAAAFAAFHTLPHRTWEGDLTVGDYVTRLKNPQAFGLDEATSLKLLYAYHHGGAVAHAAEHLPAVTRMGARLRELGIDAVVYQTPVPVEKGSELFGTAFRELTQDNFVLLERAFREGYGSDAEILQTGTCFTSAEFIDPRDASEHLNEAGRKRLASLIADATKDALAARRQP